MDAMTTGSGNSPKPLSLQHLEKETDMSAPTANFFDNPMSGGSSNGGWLPAVVAGVAGYAAGNGGFGGNGGGRPTIDQLDARFNGLQGQMAAEALREQGTASTNAITGAISGVKDAVTHGDAHTNLALCGLGHNMQAGFAAVNSTILSTAASAERLALQQALDAERARATELRIALSEHKNQSGHAATQVLVQQLVNQGNA